MRKTSHPPKQMERPMFFKANMVRAILSGRKTQTRRVIKPQPNGRAFSRGELWTEGALSPEHRSFKCPYGVAGDRLWARETHWRWGKWIKNGLTKTGKQAWTFKAIGEDQVLRDADQRPSSPASLQTEVGWHKRPSIFMPRWASRITLEIKRIRVERLQDISEADAKAEGIEVVPSVGCAVGFKDYICDAGCYEDPRNSYRSLWDSINGKGAWEQNPWVWVIDFCPVDSTKSANASGKPKEISGLPGADHANHQPTTD